MSQFRAQRDGHAPDPSQLNRLAIFARRHPSSAMRELEAIRRRKTKLRILPRLTTWSLLEATTACAVISALMRCVLASFGFEEALAAGVFLAAGIGGCLIFIGTVLEDGGDRDAGSQLFTAGVVICFVLTEIVAIAWTARWAGLAFQ